MLYKTIFVRKWGSLRPFLILFKLLPSWHAHDYLPFDERLKYFSSSKKTPPPQKKTQAEKAGQSVQSSNWIKKSHVFHFFFPSSVLSFRPSPSQNPEPGCAILFCPVHVHDLPFTSHPIISSYHNKPSSTNVTKTRNVSYRTQRVSHFETLGLSSSG